MYKHFSIISLLNDIIYCWIGGWYINIFMGIIGFFIFYAVHYYLTSVMVVVFQGLYKYRIENDITLFEIPILFNLKTRKFSRKIQLFVLFWIFSTLDFLVLKMKEWQLQKQLCHSLYYYFYAYPVVHYFFINSVVVFWPISEKENISNGDTAPLDEKEVEKMFFQQKFAKATTNNYLLEHLLGEES